MALDKALVLDALSAVADPRGGGDVLVTGAVRHVAACDGFVSVRVLAREDAGEDLARAICQAVQRRADEARETLRSLAVEIVDEGGTVQRTVRFGESPAGQVFRRAGRARASVSPSGSAGSATRGGASALTGVRHVLAVGAGKGGVGKSAVAVNLAVGLARRGLAVGLLDGDIYGPSIPTMLGLDALEQTVVSGRLQPFYVHGIKAITIGKLVEPERPLIWRGPMAHGAFKQLAEQTDWGELDFLVIDLPPGTGDVSLTMAQVLRLTGAVVVCTPQRVALDDAVRATRMFQSLGIEVLGVVENMSYFVGNEGTVYDLFGRGGAERMAARLNVPFLGAIPIAVALREHCDRGDPSANFAGDTPLRRALETMVENVLAQASLAAVRQGASRPTLTIR